MVETYTGDEAGFPIFDKGGALDNPSKTGIPVGGTDGQVLTKQSDDDGDAGWATPLAPDEAVNGIPTGGAEGQMLVKASATNYDAEWVDPPEAGEAGEAELPELTGHEEDILAVKADGTGVEWIAKPVDGEPGEDGTPGVGIPTGGTTGQILAKTSNDDLDTGWINPPSDSSSLTAPLVADFTIGKQNNGNVNPALSDNDFGLLFQFTPDNSGVRDWRWIYKTLASPLSDWQVTCRLELMNNAEGDSLLGIFFRDSSDTDNLYIYGPEAELTPNFKQGYADLDAPSFDFNTLCQSWMPFGTGVVWLRATHNTTANTLLVEASPNGKSWTEISTWNGYSGQFNQVGLGGYSYYQMGQNGNNLCPAIVCDHWEDNF